MNTKNGILLVVCTLFLFWGTSTYANSVTLVAKEGKAELYSIIPDGGTVKDALFHMYLGRPGNGVVDYETGYWHASIVAGGLNELLEDRYSCLTEQELTWLENVLYPRLAAPIKDTVNGFRDGLASKGFTPRFGKIVLNATQAQLREIIGVHPPSFMWCAWATPNGAAFTHESAEVQIGSFGYWWKKFSTGLFIHSPDLGPIAKVVTESRVQITVTPKTGYRYTTLTWFGNPAYAGMNETGLAIGATAGKPATVLSTPTSDNGILVPVGYMPLAAQAIRVLQNISSEEDIINRLERDVLVRDAYDGLNIQIAWPGGSAVWESGCRASESWPSCGRRLPGDWNRDGEILPVAWAEDLLITQLGVYSISSSDASLVVVDSTDVDGVPYAGRVFLDGVWKEWRRWLQIGRAKQYPADPNIETLYSSWFAAFGTTDNRQTPPLLADDSSTLPDAYVASTRDGLSGFFISKEGAVWGTWNRDGNFLHVIDPAGVNICTGWAGDFGPGVAGYCKFGSTDLHFTAWKFVFPDCSEKCQDGMNLNVLKTSVAGSTKSSQMWFQRSDVVVHNRTLMTLDAVGRADTLTRESFFSLYQWVYYTLGNSANAPFGTQSFDLTERTACSRPSIWHWNGKTYEYQGGLNRDLVPVCFTPFE